MKRLAPLLLLCGCAVLRSTTDTISPDGTKIHTQSTVRTFFDSRSELTKFNNRSTATNAGTYIGGLNQESSSTNLTSLIQAVAQGVAQGVIAGAKP